MEIDVGVILAGGKSRRMGKDKKFLLKNGETFLEHQYNVLSKIFKNVFVSVNKRSEKVKFPQIADMVDAGVLGGIYSSLKELKKPAFFVAVDMPFISEDIVDRFSSYYNDDIDLIVSEYRGKIEPLFAVYSPSCLRFMEKNLKVKDFRIINFFDKVKIKVIPSIRFYDLDNESKFLKNINNRETYNKFIKEH